MTNNSNPTNVDYYMNSENAYKRLKSEYEEHGKLVVAVDYDDTLYDCHKKGRSYDCVINLLKQIKPYSYIIIWSGSTEERYPSMYEYLNKIGVEVDGINITSPIIDTGRKIYANIFLDDRAGLETSYKILKRLADEIDAGLVTYAKGDK